MTQEQDIPSISEIDSMLAEMSPEDQSSVRRCVEELNDMVEQYGPDVLMISTMVVSANIAREEPLN
jgi:hypothetical protein